MKIKIKLKNVELDLKPGMFTRSLIATYENDSALIIPTSYKSPLHLLPIKAVPSLLSLLNKPMKFFNFLLLSPSCISPMLPGITKISTLYLTGCNP